MRYLNKIVFINSAHVPYAEIKLDGNVHFIGTQGVGKSTLLRAILFFYNANKSRLGIGTSQRKFDEFYLPYPDSYIIYEVMRENGPFCVLLANRQGRAAYRIIDCAYQRDHYIQSDGSALYEWGKISQRIGAHVFKSNTIRQYETFLNILYGNTAQVEKDLRRFCLLESSRYQHVPRIIQNIFLNQSLESRAIKDTIIDSMEFTDEGIDLNSYRKHVKEFRQKYEDVWKWYKKEGKNGRVKVRDDADRVMDRYGSYESSRRDVSTLSGQMRYALRRDEEALPALQEDSRRAQDELARQRRLMGEEEAKYTAERDKISREEGVLKDKLKETEQKRKHYEEIHIEDIARRMQTETERKMTAENLEIQERALTDKQLDITTKYDKLRVELDRYLLQLQTDAQQRKAELDHRRAQEAERQREACQQGIEQARSRYAEQLEVLQEEKNELLRRKGDLQTQYVKVDQTNPQAVAMQELAAEITRLKEEQAELMTAVSESQRQIDHLTADTTLSVSEAKNRCEADVMQITHRIEAAEEALQQTEALLKRQEGSLIEWLEQYVDGWENTLGRVLDEGNVLYNNALYPKLSANASAHTLCGVELQFDQIDREVRTPEMVRQEAERQTECIASLKKEATARRQQLTDEVTALEAKPQATLKRLRMDKINKDARLNLLPQLMDEARKRYALAERDLAEWRAQQKEQLKEQQFRVGEQLTEWERRKTQLGDVFNKERARIEKEADRQMKAWNVTYRIQAEQIEKEYREAEIKAEQQKKEWAEALDKELRGNGVDTDRLADIRRQAEEVRRELRFIEEHRRDYMWWQRDKEEYFDLEPSRQERLKLVRTTLNELKNKYELRRQKLAQALAKSQDEVNLLKAQCDKLAQAIQHVKAFVDSNSGALPILVDAREKATQKPLDDILEELRNKLQAQQSLFDSFKGAVQMFKANFSAQNYFNFRTELNSDEDYMEYAAELHEFISNQKIEEYRVRTSQDYAYLIQRISREVGDQLTHRGQITATIHDINRDFRENNFTGVIKDIELRDQPSNDPMMNSLLNIKTFNDENLFNIGQVNLFSDEKAVAETNSRAVALLMSLMDRMDAEPKRDRVTLADTFKLEFKVRENDNDTDWVEKLSNVGSDGTDILVKAMVNIMLINVFKRKASHKFGDFKLHCMMDEIGKLHPNNVEGILDFANKRNIYLINSSPTTYNAEAYRYTYTLSKDANNQTVVRTLLTVR
jgi:hypothetical protein